MIGKSGHILDSIELSIEPYIVKDAVVVIYENGIPYDTLVYQPNYIYKSPQNKSIRDGYTYSVKVSATGFTSVEASAIVPSVSEAPGVTRVKDARVTSYGEHQDEVTVTLNDPTEKNFYLLQIYHADAGFGGSTEYPIYCASTTDKDLEKAQVVFGSQDGTPQVQLTFTSEGTKIFGDITKRNVGKPVAIVP